MTLYRPIPFAHELLSQQLSNASYVIDATCGNGYDSQYIASLLEKNGKLFCFDIQKTALTETAKKLQKASCEIQLFQQGHETMIHRLANYQTKIDAIIFNLGFLPHSDKSVQTLSETTYRAILQAIAMLRYKGLLILVTYPGHEEGKREQELIDTLLKKQQPNTFHITKYQQLGITVTTPIVYAIEKRSR